MQDVYGCIKSVLPEHQVNVKDSTKLESKCEVFIENLRYLISKLFYALHILESVKKLKNEFFKKYRREDLRITFWGHAARQFDIESVKRKSPPVLAVFTSLIIGKYLGKPQLQKKKT